MHERTSGGVSDRVITVSAMVVPSVWSRGSATLTVKIGQVGTAVAIFSRFATGS